MSIEIDTFHTSESGWWEQNVHSTPKQHEQTINQLFFQRLDIWMADSKKNAHYIFLLHSNKMRGIIINLCFESIANRAKNSIWRDGGKKMHISTTNEREVCNGIKWLIHLAKHTGGYLFDVWSASLKKKEQQQRQ